MDAISELLGSAGVEGEDLLLPEIAAESEGGLVLLGERPVLETDTAHDGIGEVVRGKVVVAEQGIRLDLEITHLSKLLHQRTEGVEGGDRLVKGEVSIMFVA